MSASCRPRRVRPASSVPHEAWGSPVTPSGNRPLPAARWPAHLAGGPLPARAVFGPDHAPPRSPSGAPLRAQTSASMTKNIGLTDRRIRFAAAAVLAALALFAVDGALAWVLGAAAVMLVLTSSVGTCPAYLPFHFSTRR